MLEVRAGSYGVLVLFPPPQAGFRETSIASRGPTCAGGHGRLAEAGTVTIGLCMP